ncbi:MAG: hypothetical protein JSW11_09160 [Candidatus Heimdallarchaeota archaeon]|nr:MAG: hypothetical protein JSW11_09160 [Candidatus Heimdallarchaeota archaeon]
MSRIVLRNGNVFDLTTGSLNNGQTIVIKDEKIHWVDIGRTISHSNDPQR